ncbi:cbb3-type cytochrome oxidase assembly protein CcoS [Pseudohalioglobus sediminis]|uniref:Cbb3-type cytochrome oxidase assembly protein CcoS n=1 Tax=Pseudohalioglobus sediminis TaxID=2606449 RepID=A0A5B0X299_9GAMM|nr:cbb3-type cytochrome oxidase assembly protein CcoS [Pseudohalioglobus sediminis]KAA1193376.1 cbb3-type cytochrome oxidase assembly protein CcoS [Pseudohalioglobus sediminis]
MDSLYLLIPVALVFVAVGIKLLLWAIDNGQYDDLDKEAWRIIAEEQKHDAKHQPEEGKRQQP